MNVIYISSTSSGMHSSSIYYDLLMEFVENGHNVTIVYAREKRGNLPTAYYEMNGMNYLGVRVLNITKNRSLIEKGVSTITIDGRYKRAIKKHLKELKFDLLLYSTPPISLISTVKYLQKRNDLISILMLKDIFPQNAVDLGMFKKTSFLYKYFRNKELELYNLFDKIGTMSPANSKYIIKNSNVNSSKVFNLPNAIKIKPVVKRKTRESFGISSDKTVLLYGGNLGKPQSIPFMLDCARSIKNIDEIVFIVAGSGTDSYLLEKFIDQEKQSNFIYLGVLPPEEYENLTHISDIGLIFLNERFTIPNYPQRILSYMNACIPIISSTDTCTDVGKESEENGYGFSINSNSVSLWHKAVMNLVNDKELRIQMGKKGYDYLCNHFSIGRAYDTILKEYKKEKNI